MFGLGLLPSGSKDPFGLRRAAQGAVRIAFEGWLAIDLGRLVTAAVKQYGKRLTRGPAEVDKTLRPFLDDRIRYVLGLYGYAYDEIEAGLAAGAADLPDLRARVEAIHRVRGEPGFLSVVQAAKRIANIVKDTPPQPFDPGRLVEPAERELATTIDGLQKALSVQLKQFEESQARVQAAAEAIAGPQAPVQAAATLQKGGEAIAKFQADLHAAAAQAERYESVIRHIAEVAPALDRFFAAVLVMDRDEGLRDNRIGLLQKIQRMMNQTVRLSEVVVDGTDHRRGAS
jgi:glycyl-tRNA synthetase beta chain